MTEKLRMSLSMDLDNKWSYLKTHGSDKWQCFPSYFDIAVPRILEFLEKRDLKITFFIVGQDAALEKNQHALKQIASAGHEVANHSFKHEPWLHLYSKAELDQEIGEAERAIETVTGQKPVGFRGPGFSLSTDTLEVLHARGYRYDASTFPSILNPIARAYFFSKSQLSAEEKETQKGLYGSFSDAFGPIKPYRWRTGNDNLIELPVTTMPFFRTPIHTSYLVYLGSYSPPLANCYLRMAMLLCQVSRIEPSMLLHPLEFLGSEDESDLGFFPAMNLPASKKLAMMNRFFDIFQKTFQPVTLGEVASGISQSADQPGLRNP